MADSPVSSPVRLERLPPLAWLVIAVLALSGVHAVMQIAVVRPYLWPAGPGARLSGDPAARLPLVARPPDTRSTDVPGLVSEVIAHGSAAAAGIADGARIGVVARGPDRRVALADAPGDDRTRLAEWRALYRMGVRGTVTWTPTDAPGRDLAIDRLPVWETAAPGWSRAHLGMLVQCLVFTGGALALMLLRSDDLTAALCALALALSGVAGGGPLLGEEQVLPFGGILSVFSWIAGPLAFPVIALAIVHFPSPSPIVVRHPWLRAVPFIIAAPMILPALGTSLYLAGAEAAAGIAAWDAGHPGVYATAFAAALSLNLLAIGEGVYRYRFNHDAGERRRIRMAVYTAVPGVVAYAIKDGVPMVALLAGVAAPHYPVPVLVLLQAAVLLPAFGLAYAVGVARVLGPRVVLRRSLQYALARRTLSLVAILPAVALVASLIRNRERTIGELVAGSAGLYVLLIAGSVAAIRYRERARVWLDQRFFREEYDARKILLSLASRVRYETDPGELAAMVVDQIDAALHPESVAILVNGVEEGCLSPVTIAHGAAPRLRLDSGLAGMLRWSEEPLEVVLRDARSPVRRLPSDEQDWLRTCGAALLVPVLDRERALLAVIVLGDRRSEEAYTDEDRQLLASIAAQIGLGFDVARLQRLADREITGGDTTRIGTALTEAVAECPRCGRCEESATARCPNDGAALRPVPGLPRTIDHKYRIEQLLGRGGMGAVYRARDMRLDRAVALKVVRAELLGDPEARLRFRREAQIVARLQHPSIVAVYDYGTLPDGGAYLVMELVKGEDLRQVLQRQPRMPLDRTLRVLETVCAAIQAAHDEGVLHRDLKPENILLPSAGVVAKVLDFGVAKVVDRDDDQRLLSAAAPTLVTAPGLIIGTPAYMAPEQFRGLEPDARTDVFSLGAIAFEMLSGTLPFGRGSLGEVILAQARGAAAMPAGSAPAALERAIRRALQPDPDDRPPSARAFAHLLAASAGE